MLNVKVYTDGACSGNPGPGGWASLLLIESDNIDKIRKVVLKGGQTDTTNNKMELTAVTESLKFIANNFGDYTFNIEVYSDSSYVVNPINQGWLDKWQVNGWKTSKGDDVQNKDLWVQLLEFLTVYDIPVFIKVKGHAGDKYNEYVDKIAVEESNKYKRLILGFKRN